jgi:gamma-glutamylcyclotransferase (GGCT)/AIG2-like uncharacterized protein YtfP
MDKLFVYGTLIEDTFVRELIGRVPPSQPAVLSGYGVGRHPTAPHATAEPDPGASIAGKVYEGLTPDELERIDRYEGVPEGLYRRVGMTVEVGLWRADAWVYMKA